MNSRVKTVVAGGLLLVTAMALGLVVSVILGGNPAPTTTAANNTAQQSNTADNPSGFDINTDDGNMMFDDQDMPFDMGAMPGNLSIMMNQAQQFAQQKGFQLGRGGNANGPEAQGVIKTLENSNAKITLANGRVVNINSNTVIGDSNGKVDQANLKVGDRVMAVGTVETDKSVTAKYLLVLPAIPQRLTGTLKSVDAGAKSLVLTNSNTEWKATLDNNATITKDGKAVSLGDLALSQNVTVVGTVDQTAKTIKATGVMQGQAPRPDMAFGKVKSVDGTNGLTLTQTDPRTQNSTDVTVKVNADTKYLGTNVKSLGDIKSGDNVVVRGTKQSDGSILATEIGKGNFTRGGFGPGMMDGRDGKQGGFGPGRGMRGGPNGNQQNGNQSNGSQQNG